MSRTYTLNAINIYGGRRAGINMYLQGFSPVDTKRVGWYRQGSTDYAGAVSLFFDSAVMASLRTKTIESIKLVVNSSDTFAYKVPILYNVKANASTTDWSQDNYAYEVECPRYGKIPELNLTSFGIPDYDAYVLGGYYRTYSYVSVTSAVLTVITAEVAKTITYNVNGGTNQPEATVLWGESSWVGNVTSSAPTRTGYSFDSWNTEQDGSGTSYALGASITLSADITLYAQWVALKSTISSAPDTEIGSEISVNWSNYGNFTNKIRFVFGSINTGEIDVSGTSYSYSIPATWYNQIPNATSGVATVYLYTYLDGVLLGTDSASFDAIVPDAIAPSISSISATKVNENQTVAAWDIYLQNYSKVLIAVSGGVAGQGASIVSYQFIGQNINVTNQTSGGSSNATSEVIEISGSLVYSVKITDSRGRTATLTTTITVAAYALPAVGSVLAIRANSDGTENAVTGTSIKATPLFTWTQVGSNALTSSLSYKKHSDQNYTVAQTGITTGTSYVIAVGLADIAFSYDVKVEISDSLNNTATFVVIVPPVVGIGFGLKNDRAHFGGPTEEAGLVIDWDTKLKGDLIMRDGNGNSVTLTYADLVALLGIIS